MTLSPKKISIFSFPISHVKIGVKMSGFFRRAEAKTIVPISSKVCMYLRIIKLHNFLANISISVV